MPVRPPVWDGALGKICRLCPSDFIYHHYKHEQTSTRLTCLRRQRRVPKNPSIVDYVGADHVLHLPASLLPVGGSQPCLASNSLARSTLSSKALQTYWNGSWMISCRQQPTRTLDRRSKTDFLELRVYGMCCSIPSSAGELGWSRF